MVSLDLLGRGQCACLQELMSFIRNDREGSVLLNITTEHVSPLTRFVRRTRDFRIERHKLLVFAAQTGH